MAVAAFRAKERMPQAGLAWLTNPVTFHDKLTRKLFLDRRSYMVATGDKIAVRDHVTSTAGDHVLADLHLITDDPEDIDLKELPLRFVMKPSHASQQVRVVTNSTLKDITELRRLAREWLRGTYGTWTAEWWYWQMPHRVMIEEFLGDPVTGEPPADYKFFVINGTVRLIQVDVSRFADHRRSVHLPDWTPIDTLLRFPQPDATPRRPKRLDEMTEIAQSIGRCTDFVRVDLYELPDRVVFGEMTHVPGGASERFSDASVDRWLGTKWRQPRRYR